MSQEMQERLQKEISNLALGKIPSEVFQFDYNRSSAEEFLQNTPSVPFLIRKSSMEGYFAISALNSYGNCSHILISPPDENCEEFLVHHYADGIKTKLDTLNNYAQMCLDQFKKAEHWQQFKLKLEQNTVKKAAVLSIQSLDEQKIALSVDQLEKFAQTNPGLKWTGDGHTGFAMAKALEAPFVVLRSKENREEANKILQDNLVDHGLLVLTGHGSPDGDEISGIYIAVAPDTEQKNNCFMSK